MFKKVEWSIIAQCDLFAVERLIDSHDRPTMKTVIKMNEKTFKNKINRDDVWKRVFEAICDSYQSLQPSFKISHDKFGGYCLLYTGLEIIRPQTVLNSNAIGFIKPVPEGAISNLSVMSSQRTGETLILLGPLRFVNSDCSPNAEYDFTGDSGIVKLRFLTFY